MKKIIIILMLLFFIPSLVACGGNNESGDNSQSNQDSTEKEANVVLDVEDAKGMIAENVITLENIDEFFEWQEKEYIGKDDFGELTGDIETTAYYVLKEGFIPKAEEGDDAVAIKYSIVLTIEEKTGLITSTHEYSNEATSPLYNYSLYYNDDPYWVPQYLIAIGSYMKIESAQIESKTTLSDFSISKVKGVVYSANVPEEMWIETTEDIDGYSANELGRHLTFKKYASTDNFKIILFENGVVAETENDEIQGTTRYNGVCGALLHYIEWYSK